MNLATQPRIERRASSLLTAAGLGLALWLTLLKWRSLPCLGGGCETVIQSRYGSVLGVPVGVFGAALWLALVWPLPARLRTAAHATLALGAIGFMVVQFGVLRAFCPYCTAHAAAALTAWRWRKVRPASWALALGATLALGGYGLAQRAADHHATAVTRPAELTAGIDAIFPFDDPKPVSAARPVLVLSVTCPACLDLLRAVTNAPWPAGKLGPAVYIKSDARDHALAVVWLAACTETAGSTPRDRFMAVTAMLVAQRELVASDPSAAATWLAGIFRPSPEARRGAELLLVRQAARLTEAGVTTTPWLLPITGAARAVVTTKDF
jgi:uncharacterized membrane protein